MSLKILRKSGRYNLYIIPYIFTFANAFFGLLSVINALNDNLIASAYCIILAACMDCFDGRLARAFGSTSYLGMELDSLCDAISFCFSPTILIYSWLDDDLGVKGVFVLALYLCAGLFRLAKFNTTCDEQRSFFCGLPTTIAAFFCAAIVINHSWLAAHHFAFFLTRKSILSVMSILAFLMVSTIRFPSFKYNKLRHFFIPLMIIICISALISVLRGYPFFFFVLLGYLFCSILLNVKNFLHKITFLRPNAFKFK